MACAPPTQTRQLDRWKTLLLFVNAGSLFTQATTCCDARPRSPGFHLPRLLSSMCIASVDAPPQPPSSPEAAACSHTCCSCIMYRSPQGGVGGQPSYPGLFYHGTEYSVLCTPYELVRACMRGKCLPAKGPSSPMVRCLLILALALHMKRSRGDIE